MNKKQRKAKAKEQRLKQKAEAHAKRFNKHANKEVDDSEYWYIGPTDFTAPIPEKEREVPGFNVPPVSPQFDELVARNIWHHSNQLDEFVRVIKELSREDSYLNFDDLRDQSLVEPIDAPKRQIDNDWSWSRNWNCKYINLRIDMRDGGFILTNDKGERINLDQLKWQWKSIEDKDVPVE